MDKLNFENKTLLIITHNYTSFVKDPVEVLSKYFDHIYVLVRHNPIADISQYLPINNLKPFNKSSMVDLRNKPDNISVIMTNIIYTPTANQYRKLGDRHFKAVGKVLRRYNLKFDMIHAHFTWTAGYVGARLKEVFDIPFVLTVHENRAWFLEEYNSTQEEIYYTWKSADAITRPNSIDIPLLRRLNESVITVPNGFTSEKFSPVSPPEARRRLNLPLDRKIIFGLGFLTERKGFQYLIEAMDYIRKKNSNVLCLIGGSGEQKNRLEQKMKQLQLEDSIRLVGAIAHHEVHLWMNACDLFVLPSLSESFGVVQLEAMACGKPVVATYNGGSEEIIISEEYGLLCQPANPKELAEKILLALDKNWDSERIIKYAKQFTWESNAEKTLQVYEAVLGNKHQ
jgi:glycosyltransferase involved in cell wall biosynthesis